MALKIYFGSLATDYIAESGRTIADVAETIGKTPANQFSKWKAGKWTYIAERKLLRVIDEIAGRDRDRRVNLMIAYLIDMTPEVFRPLIDIKPRSGDASANDAGLIGSKWSPSLRAKLEAIAAAYGRDADFKRMVDNIGEWSVGVNRRVESKLNT
jgi:hypothetical protein